MAKDTRRAEGVASGSNIVNLYNAYGIKGYGDENLQNQLPNMVKKSANHHKSN